VSWISAVSKPQTLIIRPAPEQPNGGDNLHVSGLAKGVSQTMLHDMFSKHGKVS